MTTTAPFSVLLVDDDSFLIDMYSLKFSHAGHAVATAQSAMEALEKLRNGLTPDAVVFDLVMPEIDGFGLLEAIQNEGLAKGAALIVLSNQGEKEDIERARTLGAVGHIIKANAIPSEVLALVEQYVQKTRTS